MEVNLQPIAYNSLLIGLDSILGENEMKVSFAEKAKTEALSTMKVLSYNLWNFNKDYHERMNKIATFIKTSDPDIIGLQEVRISNWYRDLSVRYLTIQGISGQEKSFWLSSRRLDISAS